MIDLDSQSLEEIREILRRYVPGCETRVFGSRVRGAAQPYSDIDLAVVADGPLEKSILSELRDAFAESDLPIQVDVVDWRAISENFRKIISERYEILIGDIE
jgi:uncharacterized protein